MCIPGNVSLSRPLFKGVAREISSLGVTAISIELQRQGYARWVPLKPRAPLPAEQDGQLPRPSGATIEVSRSPLLQAALVLVPPSVTESELRQRFASAGAELLAGMAGRLLEELAELGLVRASRRHHDGRRFVATSLGMRSIESGVHGEAAIPLEELERLRTDLLSTIAHELRTPLTAVRTSVGLLLDAKTSPTVEQQRTLLESIERNGDRMQRLIGDILELSRFRAGGVTLQLRQFSANALAESAVSALGPIAAKHHQTIEIRRGVPNEHAVFGDRRRLEQALLNLVSNAEKFSPDDGTVIVRVELHGDNTAWLVSDKGPGISEADQARLFERFFVGRNDRSGPREGIGLGLPTALAIAQAHGGTIEVDSTLGVGSTFALVVPTAGPEDEP
jgi:signal transduction histidine kinase